MKDRNGRTIGMTHDKSVWAHIEGNPKPTVVDFDYKPTKKREPMTTRTKLAIVGIVLIVLSILMLLGAIITGVLGIWSGDGRWGMTGVILAFSGFMGALFGTMLYDLNR